MAKTKTTAIHNVIAPLLPLLTPVADLQLDPENARRHDAANLQAIRSSIEAFGQREPIIVNKAGNRVEAGNGRLTVIRSLGWTHAAVVFVSDDPATARGFSIADNRTAELASWDLSLLDILSGQIEKEMPDLYEDLLLAELTAKSAPPEPQEAPPPPAYQILVTCEDELKQREIIDLLTKRGLTCEAV